MSPPPTHAKTYRTKVIPIIDGQDMAVSGSAELSYQFLNHIHRPVTVITRSGLRLIIPFRHPPRRPLSGKRPKEGLRDACVEPSFVIRFKTHVQSDVNLDVTELSHDLGQATSLEAKAYMDAVRASEDRWVQGGVQSVWVEYHIPASDFDQEGGVLYLQNLDLQLSVLDQASTAPHPRSYGGQRLRDAQAFDEDMSCKGVFYGVYIRDSIGAFGNRFININGTVHGVEVLTDTSQERDGVYCITTHRTTSNFVPHNTFVEYYDFEEADEKLGLYQTYKEAQTLGNPQERFKREYEERLQQLKLDELSAREAKAEQERILAEQQAKLDLQKEVQRQETMRYEYQLQRINQLNKLMAAELERREQNYRREMQLFKEFSDASGHERRESMELLKLIPTLITTAATIVAAYKKLKSV